MLVGSGQAERTLLCKVVRATIAATLKTALTLICSFTLLATGYLSLSIIVLHPPRANYPRWFLMAALFVAQSVLTLGAVSGAMSGGWTRWPLLAGGLAIMGLGASWAHATVTGPHFEGYALVLGSVLVAQGALTMAYLSLGSFA